MSRPRFSSHLLVLGLTAGLVAGYAGITRALAADGVPKRVGDITYVFGTGVTVNNNSISEGGNPSPGARPIAPLYAGATIAINGLGAVSFRVAVNHRIAYCNARTQITAKVATKSSLVSVRAGTVYCATQPTGGQKQFDAGSNLSIRAFDPVFEIVAKGSTRIVKVRRGAVIVAASIRSKDAVVVNSNTETTVRTGGSPTEPTRVTYTPVERQALNQLSRSVPPPQDTTPPPLQIAEAPPKRSSIRSAEFVFSSETGVTFTCALDSTDFRVCQSPITYDHLQPGSHTFNVRATDAAGNTTRTVTYTWTIDASRIAYAVITNGQYHLYTSNADGTDLIDLGSTGTTQSDNYHGPAPAISPDGKQIAYAAISDSAEDVNIFISGIDGQSRRQLTQERFNANPTWSPDGRIAFESTRNMGSQLWIINVNGTGERQLTFDQATATDAAWSPDGTRIAFASRADTPGAAYQLYLISPNGTGEVPVMTTSCGCHELGPTWSDSRTLAFYSRRDQQASRIYTVNVDSHTVTPITRSPAGVTDQTQDSNPAYAPDGQSLAFQRLANGTNTIYVVSPQDGNNPTPISTSEQTPNVLTPSW